MTYLNIASYKFINLSAEYLPALQNELKQQAAALQIKGTILLSVEGINLFLAGTHDAINVFIHHLTKISHFNNLIFKRSESDHLPFQRLRVRIKSEIISMKQPHIQPEKATAPYLEPAEFKQWYSENKEMLVLDTRNNYEVDIGTFENAKHFNIENFTDFPAAIAALPNEAKNKPIVTFCTGGIRCEKAAAILQAQGFQQVWQLKGGILNYFEQCGGEYFNGNCFVFDQRRAVNANLEEIKQ